MSNQPQIKTLGELKASGYQPKTIKEELRSNLLPLLHSGRHPFEGIHGYEDSVIPAVERAILAGHDVLFLGLRGQAKTRMARQLVGLLDAWVPVLEGSELNEDPMAPLTAQSKGIIAQWGDETPVGWLHRSDRFFEKLATPDTTVADLIGDIDPIKAANEKLSFSDERVIHYGMIPRAHRSIFVINELPDLQPRLQVALFNILQEGDIQIRGFQKRLPVELQFVFTANPEDYTSRGSIVTPLKDRIGSQIHTHYPEDVATARTITAQETKRIQELFPAVRSFDLAEHLIEELAFAARESEFVDPASGVSARMTISAFELLLTTAERRRLMEGASTTQVRLSDFMGILPALVGKVELVYEGEQQGAEQVAEHILGHAVLTAFKLFFPPLQNMKRTNENNPYLPIQNWFSDGNSVELMDDFSLREYENALDIAPINAFVREKLKATIEAPVAFWKELLLWALSEKSQIARKRTRTKLVFDDLFGNLLGGE